MHISYRETSSPTIEPVTLAQAKQHLRIDYTDDDSYIASLITAARQFIENKTNMAIFNRSMILSMDAFPWPGWSDTTGSTAHDYYLAYFYKGLAIKLPFPRAVSVQSISYLLNDGVTWQTLSPNFYHVDLESEPARITPYPSNTWPYQQNYIPGQVKVLYTAGSWEFPVSETFIAPSASPYQYTLLQASALVTFNSVTDSQGNTVAVTQANGVVTLPQSVAGETLTASYTVNGCPQSIIFAMLMLIAHWYANRADVTELNLKQTPRAVDAMLAPFMRMTLF